MRLALVGSRLFSSYNVLYHALLEILEDKVDVIVSGGAKGADTLAEQFAREWGIPVLVLLPNWDKFGRSAGMIRNKSILDNCDKLVAFWDGRSPGTVNSINMANKNNKLLKVILV